MKFGRKNNKIPAFYTPFARKMPEFYITFAEIFFRDFFFLGGGALHGSNSIPSPTPTAVPQASRQLNLALVMGHKM